MREKKLFGEFLVEKGIVSTELLLDALLEQLRGMQSLPEFMNKSGLVAPAEILAAFRLQQTKQLDFSLALRSSTSLSPEKLNGLFEAYAASRVPVGELLVNRGVPLEKLIHAFDEFLNEYASQPVHAPPPPKDHLLLKEYLDLCGGVENRDRALRHLLPLRSCESAVSAHAERELTECAGFLRLLRSGASLLNLAKTEELLRELDDAFLRLGQGGSTLRPRLGEELHDALAGAVRQIWENQHELATNGKESGLETASILSIIRKLSAEILPPVRKETA